MTTELTPLEKVESLFEALLHWYGDAEHKELRAAAKLLLVSLEQFSIHGGAEWHALVMEYANTLQQDPEKFQKIMQANRGADSASLNDTHTRDLFH